MKKETKKIIALLMVIIFALVLSACGGKSDSSSQDTSADSAQSGDANGNTQGGQDTDSLSVAPSADHDMAVFPDGNNVLTSYGFGLEYPSGYTCEASSGTYMIYAEDMDPAAESAEMFTIVIHSIYTAELNDDYLEQLASGFESSNGVVNSKEIVEYNGIPVAKLDVSMDLSGSSTQNKIYNFNVGDSTYYATATSVGKDFDDPDLYDKIMSSIFIQ